MTDTSPPTPSTLGFEVDVEGVAFGDLVKVAQTFHQLAAEVTNEVVGGRGVVRWVVTQVDTGSVAFQVRPLRTGRQIPQRAADEIPAILVRGIESLDGAPARPQFFSIRALSLARSLADMAGKNLPHVTLRHGEEYVRLSPRVSANISRVLIGDEATLYSEYGTVEGRLEALSVHSDRVFSIWDSLTGQRILCHFGYRIPSQEVGAAAERRVVVSGEIHYDIDGNVERVTASSIDVMPEEDELPTAEDVLGILADG